MDVAPKAISFTIQIENKSSRVVGHNTIFLLKIISFNATVIVFFCFWMQFVSNHVRIYKYEIE